MPSIIERALQLASSGAYPSLSDVRVALKREGYVQIDHHLSGSSIRMQLRRMIVQATPIVAPPIIAAS